MREPIPPTVRPKTSVRDRVKEMPALFREDPGFNLIPGQFEKRETLFVLDADHAASNWSDAQDLVTYHGTRNRQLLKPSSYFDQCLSAQDDAALHDCLAAWSDGCSDTGASCP